MAQYRHERFARQIDHRLQTCGCQECARLDLEFPGEGIQLALWRAVPLGDERAQPEVCE